MVKHYIKTIFDHVRLPDIDDSNKNFFDAVLVNNHIPANLAEKYEQAGSLPVEIDITEIRRLKVELVERNLLEDNKEDDEEDRHDEDERQGTDRHTSHDTHREHTVSVSAGSLGEDER